LARRKAEAAKVAAAEREKKKMLDPSPAGDADKKQASKKRSSEAAERGRHVTIKEKGPDEDEPSGERARADPVAETNEDVDIMSTPQIQPYTYYPPRGSAQKLTEEPPAGQVDLEELEEREVRGKRVAEMIQKEIVAADAAPKGHVAGLVDVVDESEDLCDIDDDTTLAAKDSDAPPPQPQNDPEGARDPIDLDAPEIEESAAHAPRSPPSVSDDLQSAAAKATEEITPASATTPNVLQLEDAGMILLPRDNFPYPFHKPCLPFADDFRFCDDLSGQDSSHLECQGQGEKGFSA
jgi:hypothetical protein